MGAELSPALIFATSPRPKGNTDTAAAILAEVLQSQGVASSIVPLRDYKFTPCQGCNYCGVPGNACILAQRDDCEYLFGLLRSAAVVFWLAPIYFYHLPAQSKALIDRAQTYWHLKRAHDPLVMGLPPRKAHVLLIAARSRGENLFQGSLYTLQYFFEPFNISLADPMLVTGLDGPDELNASGAQRQSIAEWGLAALAG